MPTPRRAPLLVVVATGIGLWLGMTAPSVSPVTPPPPPVAGATITPGPQP